MIELGQKKVEEKKKTEISFCMVFSTRTTAVTLIVVAPSELPPKC